MDFRVWLESEEFKPQFLQWVRDPLWLGHYYVKVQIRDKIYWFEFSGQGAYKDWSSLKYQVWKYPWHGKIFNRMKKIARQMKKPPDCVVQVIPQHPRQGYLF